MPAHHVHHSWPDWDWPDHGSTSYGIRKLFKKGMKGLGEGGEITYECIDDHSAGMQRGQFRYIHFQYRSAPHSGYNLSIGRPLIFLVAAGHKGPGLLVNSEVAVNTLGLPTGLAGGDSARMQ